MRYIVRKNGNYWQVLGVNAGQVIERGDRRVFLQDALQDKQERESMEKKVKFKVNEKNQVSIEYFDNEANDWLEVWNESEQIQNIALETGIDAKRNSFVD